MAGLFKNRIIKKEKAGVFGISDLDKKLAMVKTWHAAYHDGTLKQKTEQQCEQAFNQDFFVNILGYKTFPGDVYTIDHKATTDASAQKPDAALGYFTGPTRRTIAVVEIKDANTQLDRSQKREGNLSPIQQAFKYKPQFKDCEFVIATNFYETRLFKGNQLDYERFTLD